jgi:hypothetical protein
VRCTFNVQKVRMIRVSLSYSRHFRTLSAQNAPLFIKSSACILNRSRRLLALIVR